MMDFSWIHEKCKGLPFAERRILYAKLLNEFLLAHDKEHLQRFEDARYLYHRTPIANAVKGILESERLDTRDRRLIGGYKRPKHQAVNQPWACLTTDVTNTTGGRFLFVFDKKLVQPTNSLVPVLYALDKEGGRGAFADEWEIRAINGLTFFRHALVALIIDYHSYPNHPMWNSQKVGWRTREDRLVQKLFPDVKICLELKELMQWDQGQIRKGGII